MLCSIRRERSFAPAALLFSMVTWGIKCARARRAHADYSSCICISWPWGIKCARARRAHAQAQTVPGLAWYIAIIRSEATPSHVAS